MKTWRIYTPYTCRIVIEENPGEWSRMKRFDGMSEEEVIEAVRRNILNRWPDAVLRMGRSWDHMVIDVSRDGNFYYEEPETPPFLYHIALGY